MRCNFYTERYWMSFHEMLNLIMSNPQSTDYDEGSVLLGTLQSFEWMEYVSGDSEALGRMAQYLPIFVKKKTSMNIYYWDDSDSAQKLFYMVKERFIDEYVFDLSFKLPVFNDSIWDNYEGYGLTLEQITELREECLKFWNKFMVILKMTFERYSTLLDFYSAKKSQLLDKVESLTRFNDTPQDSGEFSDDEHTTHITSSKNDYDTLMARIDEVDRKYRNLLKDWSSEFECLFIHEESL